MTCEDYPCCGHTPDDPCSRQWYDEPGAFDTSRPGNEHALCEHEYGFCDVDDEDEDLDEGDDSSDHYPANEDDAMEYGLFGGDC